MDQNPTPQQTPGPIGSSQPPTPSNPPFQPSPELAPQPVTPVNESYQQSAPLPPAPVVSVDSTAQPPLQPVAPAAPESPHPAPGIIVLQWLTYAFWGWTVLVMSMLTGSVIASFVNDAETGGFTPYAIAAVLVLLPISIICDIFYSKSETHKKTGASALVFVVHAVIFALFGIGAVIAIVISLVTLFTSSSDTTSSQIALYTAIFVAILYAAVLLRIVNPVRFPWIKRFFILFMSVTIGVVSVLGIIGPVAHERSTRHDRLIEENIHAISNGVNDYADKNKRLPENLSAVGYTGDAKKLVDEGEIKYSVIATSTPIQLQKNTGVNISQYIKPTALAYQLCVTFTKASKPSNYSSYSSYDNSTDSEGYTTYISASKHAAGQVCYKLKTTPYSSISN